MAARTMPEVLLWGRGGRCCLKGLLSLNCLTGNPPSTTTYAASGAAAFTYLLYQLGESHVTAHQQRKQRVAQTAPLAGSGGRRPHRERPWMLWLFVLCSAALGLWVCASHKQAERYSMIK